MSNLQDILQEIQKNISIKPEPASYNCEICRDRGYVKAGKDKFGLDKYVPCKCKIEQRYKQIIKNSGLGENLENYTFDKFEAYSKDLKIAKLICEEFPTNQDAKTLLLVGKSGTGKSHLATATAKKILEKNKEPLLYYRFREIMQELKGLTLDLENRNNYMGKIKNIKNLYIDDLFKNTDFRNSTEKQYVFEILDYRYSRGLKTIITSEYSFNQLLKIDEATAGRLGQMSNGYLINFDNIENYRSMKLINQVDAVKKRIEEQYGL